MERNQFNAVPSLLIQGITPEDLRKIIREEIDKRMDQFPIPDVSINEDTEEFITRKEAAKLLKISLTTLDNYNELGIIKGRKKIGHRVLYSITELKESAKGIGK